jgi:hypothetical protein
VLQGRLIFQAMLSKKQGGGEGKIRKKQWELGGGFISL